MTRFIIVTALFFAALAAITIFAVEMPRYSDSKGIDRVAEDSPSWNCHTMGNGVCGGSKKALQHDPRFRQYDRLFNCFAEVEYAHPFLSWNDRVMRCIPPVSP